MNLAGHRMRCSGISLVARFIPNHPTQNFLFWSFQQVRQLTPIAPARRWPSPNRPLCCIHSSTPSVGKRRWLYRLKLHWFDLLYNLLYSLLYNKSTTNRQAIEPLELETYRIRARGAVNTSLCQLSQFISHLPTVGVPWRNFPSSEFGTKFHREMSLFLGIP